MPFILDFFLGNTSKLLTQTPPRPKSRQGSWFSPGEGDTQPCSEILLENDVGWLAEAPPRGGGGLVGCPVEVSGTNDSNGFPAAASTGIINGFRS